MVEIYITSSSRNEFVVKIEHSISEDPITSLSILIQAKLQMCVCAAADAQGGLQPPLKQIITLKLL